MISQIFLYLVLLFLPTQFGYHFWPKFSYIFGFRIDYLSPTLYFIDLLIIIFIILNVKKIIKYLSNKSREIILILLLVFINILFSISPLNTLVWYGHLFEYIAFVLILKIDKIEIKNIIHPLFISSVVIICLEFAQLINQGSIGGILYYLGERNLNISSTNVAKIDIFGQLFLRPYSFFSHPNSLAGYLLLMLILLLKVNSKKIKIITVFIGILISTSKAAIIVTILLFIKIPIMMMWSLIIFSTTIPLFVSLSKLLNYPNYIYSRFQFIAIAKKIIAEYPYFGVGYGNYISALKNTLEQKQFLYSNLQPVHNIVYLVISEFGLLVTILVTSITLVCKTIKLNKTNYYYLLIILLLCTMDHYFYTLPQNKLLLLITLSYLV